ncbi:MAG TPA: FHA domain-containing protein [Ktedonobacteraceae bacterium]|nr:FHA domain-containing protein [Ktedonobacteraceae bacterium]
MSQQPIDQAVAYLVIKQGRQAGKRLELWKDCTTIGRSTNCDIFLEDLAVHRKQASIYFTERGYVLRDEHGNGDSFVNGQQIWECILKDGDTLSFGHTQLVFNGHEGTRPFQLASSRNRESHLVKNPDPTASAIAKLDLASARGAMRSFEMMPEMTIGRSLECDIFLEDLAVSRLHATIREIGDGGYEIEDHRSATGTYVNGMRITRYRLLEGDIVQIGTSKMTFKRSRG